MLHKVQVIIEKPKKYTQVDVHQNFVLGNFEFSKKVSSGDIGLKEANEKLKEIGKEPKEYNKVNFMISNNKVANKGYEMPNVLYEKGKIRFVGVDSSGKELFNESVNYDISQFPYPGLASTWELVDNKYCRLKTGYTEKDIANEEIGWFGREMLYFTFPKSYNFFAKLVIQIVCNKKTMEPLTHFVDRIYGLKKIEFYFDSKMSYNSMQAEYIKKVSKEDTQQIIDKVKLSGEKCFYNAE